MEVDPESMTSEQIVAELAKILQCAPNLLKQFVPSFNSYGDPLRLERATDLVDELGKRPHA